MSIALQIRPATRADIEELGDTMREADVVEIHAASGMTAIGALIRGLTDSSECWAALVDDRVMCIWGVVAGQRSVLGNGIGVGWLLTSPLVERYPRAFWKGCRAVLPEVLERWGMLVNWIDCRHDKALRWAERLGFRLGDPQAFGVLGLPFRPFTVSQEDLHV